LAWLSEQLSGQHFQLVIEDPIDRAAASFDLPSSLGEGHRALLDVMACLVHHIYLHGLRPGRDLSAGEARDEAAFLLQSVYQGARGNGYEAARLEAALPEFGMPAVAENMAESIKSWRRQLHVQWVAGRLASAYSWEVRCEAAGILMSRLSPYLPPLVAKQPPWRFADRLLDLYETWMGTTPSASPMQQGAAAAVGPRLSVPTHQR